MKFSLLSSALVLNSLLSAAPQGPGLPRLSYPASEVGSTLSYFKGIDGYAHGIATMVNGYFMLPIFDPKGTGAALEFYDLSDPRSPKLVHRQMDKQTALIRESLSIGSMDGRYYAFQGSDGIVIWDFADVTKPVMVSYLPLPDVRGARDYVGIRWVSWQAPYLYCAGTDQGLYIVDTKDLAHPKLVKHFPISEIGGFPVGSAVAVGNVLLISSTAQSDINAPGTGGRFTSLDISDPRNPFVVRTVNSVNSYASMINGYKILAPGVNGESAILDFPSADTINLLGTVDAGGQGGYAAFQDGYAFIGHHTKVAKITTTGGPPRIAWTATSPIKNKDDNFAIPLGNILFAGQDRGAESALIVHAAEADATPPVVNMVAPRDGASNIKPTTAIGITLTDEIDARSVGAKSFMLRAVGTTEPLDGWWSSATGIAHFTPRVPLQADTTYEVVIPAGGIRDVSGNPTNTPFRSTFTTGKVPPNLAPTVRFIIPADGTRITSAKTKAELQSLDADGSVTTVAMLVNGREVSHPAVGHTTVSLPELPDGEHTLTARVTDNSGQVTTSQPVRIHIATAADAPPSALLIVGKESSELEASDAAMKKRVESLGYHVSLGFAPSIATGSTAGHAVVIVSESVESRSGVGIALRKSNTPVIVCEPGCYGDMFLTDSSNQEFFGEIPDQSAIVITKPDHPLAANFTGELPVLAKSGKLNFGRPAATAIKVAQLADPEGSSPPWAIFAYEKNTKMYRDKAPARRVGWFGCNPYLADANESAWKLFDAAVRWSVEPPAQKIKPIRNVEKKNQN